LQPDNISDLYYFFVDSGQKPDGTEFDPARASIRDDEGGTELHRLLEDLNDIVFQDIQLGLHYLGELVPDVV